MGSSSRENFVKQSLNQFMEQYLPNLEMGEIDEIGLSYIVSILEELGSAESMEDLFDVEQFTEMMEAYLPGFEQIDSATVSDWMFDLSLKLLNHGTQERSDLMEPERLLPLNSNITAVDGLQNPLTRSQQNRAGNPFRELFLRETSDADNSVVVSSQRQLTPCDDVQGDENVMASLPLVSSQQQMRWRTQSSSSTASSDIASSMSGDQCASDEETDDTVQLLTEMFPGTCVMEISHCLSVANGNTEEAAQLILMRQECGQSLSQSTSKKVKKPGSKNSTCNFLDDHNVKKLIINKYSYVDVDLDKKEYKPALPKVQDKKLVRYLDSKIVSTRGERFTEIKKEDDEKMKKTFVNLKPAKQYRFH